MHIDFIAVGHTISVRVAPVRISPVAQQEHKPQAIMDFLIVVVTILPIASKVKCL